jgi:hypothetical protein
MQWLVWKTAQMFDQNFNELNFNVKFNYFFDKFGRFVFISTYFSCKQKTHSNTK